MFRVSCSIAQCSLVVGKALNGSSLTLLLLILSIIQLCLDVVKFSSGCKTRHKHDARESHIPQCLPHTSHRAHCLQYPELAMSSATLAVRVSWVLGCAGYKLYPPGHCTWIISHKIIFCTKKLTIIGEFNGTNSFNFILGSSCS